MWTYDKRLQFPINIAQPNPALAKIIISQYGGPDGEQNASLRYLSQRYNMPYSVAKATLTDIGTSVIKCSFKVSFFYRGCPVILQERKPI